MNSPAFRLAGISSGLAARLPRLHLSKLEIALLGAAALLAIGIVAFGFTGSDEPDPIETATVLPPRLETKAAPDTEIAAEAAKPVLSATVQAAAASATAAPAPSQAPLLSAPASAPSAGHFEKPQVTAAAGPDERGKTAETPLPLAADQTPDPAPTTAIATEGLRGSIDVQVAETETEVAMLEQQTGMIDTGNAAQAATGPLPDLRPAKVVKYANLRDGPADEAKVIVVVPANAEIEAEVDCNWCTVVYKGQRGYMYKNLIRRTVAEEAKAGQGLF